MEYPIDDAPEYKTLLCDCIALSHCVETIRTVLAEATPPTSTNRARDAIAMCKEISAWFEKNSSITIHKTSACGVRLADIARLHP